MRTNSNQEILKGLGIISKKIKKIPFNKLSKDSQFCKRKPRKIRPKEFLIGFFLMVFSPEGNSYKNWASKIGLLIKDTVSKQALWKRMHEGQIKFLQGVIEELIKMRIHEELPAKVKSKLNYFKRVIIEDSTHIKLNEKLSKYYPGNRNWDGKDDKAILKIQAAYELIRNRFVRFSITNYRKNDLGYSEKILEIAQRGDLIIRDLGYFILKVFMELKANGIYFISRMKKRVNIISKQDKRVIDLAKMLRKRGSLDMDVFIGDEDMVPARLIAFPVEKEVASERRRKLNRQRDSRYKPSKENLYLLGWEIFITNVDKEIFDSKDIANLYFLRWRIEIIFKSWKTHLRITAISEDKNRIRVESYIYCMLIFIVLFQVSFYNYCINKISNTKGVSLLKMMQFITNNIEIIILALTLQNAVLKKSIERNINYYCSYE